jgi:ABC-type nitrate/sulfonate/bicarbonate transport system ATPase subunit
MSEDPKPPATGTGPAGGAAVTPSTPATIASATAPKPRDLAAEAAALAMFEEDEAKAAAPKAEPAPKAERAPKAEPATAPAKVEAKPAKEPEPATITGGEKPLMVELGKPLVKPPVVAFDKVTKKFGSFTAIKDVTFSIPDYPNRGEFVSILGPSGCGKSTVIRMIAGLLPQFPQTSGTVLVDGKQIKGPGPDRGMVFQDYTSFDHRSVLDNVAFGLECRGLERAIDSAVRKQTVTTFTTHSPHGFSKGSTPVIVGVRDSSFDGKVEVPRPKPNQFTVQQQGRDAGSRRTSSCRRYRARRASAPSTDQKVGLSVKKDADKYPHELSGGMRQRVAIARTLILEPRIILMDEPFGALDPPTRTRMQDNLVALWREQSPTIFFITHSIEEAVFLGDHILIFSNSPGTVLKEIRVAPPDRPSLVMQREQKFMETVLGIREIIDRLESSPSGD